MTDDTEFTASRMISWRDPLAATEAGRSLAGEEFLHAMMSGRVPNPPFGELLRMSIVSVRHGHVKFDCRPDGSMYNATGTVHGGIMCTLLDTAASCAVLSTLPSGKSLLSIEIKVSYLRAVRALGDPIIATGTVEKLGSRVAFAAASAADSAGRTIATATTSVMILDVS